MPTPEEELTWLNAARKGDHSAFERIVNAHSRRIASTVKGMLGDTAEAEDVGQEVFITFYRFMDRFRGESSLGTFLTRIAINLSLNQIKRNRRFLGRFGSSPEQELEQRPARVESPETVLQKEKIRRAIRSLPAKFRSVIVLRLIQEYSTEETAAILKLPLGTVQSRLARAQQKLRSILVPGSGGKHE